MKKGDLVKWIGFPGASTKPATKYGIVIKTIRSRVFGDTEQRIDVLWGDGRIGRRLYQETMELISESR
jgi:hypothetical protein|tara:strand:- start:2877 stop:3080 length:204 start_codon:yes stop_codon:yes gene_type:complete